MCGLLAVFAAPGKEALSLETVDYARDLMAQRGPDAAATVEILARNGATHTLAHRRLSIQDLSAKATQPMTSASGRCSIVYNGEVFNTATLREALSAEGITCRTTSDTELILEGYEAWRPKVVQKLNGMFAFAIWDHKDQSAFLARDRIGIKPLFIAHNSGGLSCASDMRVLKALGLGQDLDEEAQALFLMLGYVPTPRTIWSGIEKLPAGTTLRWRADGSVHKETYWSAPEDTDFEENGPDVSVLIDAVVEEQLLSDVPIGLFLSGGLDSSVIASSIAGLGPQSAKNITALTVAYPGSASHDEAPVALRTADQLGLNIQVLPLEIASHLSYEKSVDALDEPLAYNAVVSQTAISELAAQAGLKVVMTGDGGDEVFGGYRWYSDIGASEYIPPGTVFRLRSLKDCRTRRIKENWDFLRGRSYRRKSALHLHTQRLFPAFRSDQVAKLLPGFSEQVCEDLLCAALSPHIAPNLPAKRQLQRLDLYTFCQDVVLTKVDRAGMAFSVEARPPLLDHRIIEWGLSRPVADRYDAASKNPLRQMVRDRGLGFLLDEPKRGFSLKTSSGPSRKLVEETIDAQSTRLGLSPSWRKVIKHSEVCHVKMDVLHFLSLWRQSQDEYV